MRSTHTVCDVASHGPFESSLGPVLYGSLGIYSIHRPLFAGISFGVLGSYGLSVAFFVTITVGCHLFIFCYPLFSGVKGKEFIEKLVWDTPIAEHIEGRKRWVHLHQSPMGETVPHPTLTSL